MGNVIELFPLFQSKRWNQALEHLAEAYSAHLDAESLTLAAFLQIGWAEDNMSEEEWELSARLKNQAESIKESAECIRGIMRDIASQIEGYEVELDGESEG